MWYKRKNGGMPTLGNILKIDQNFVREMLDNVNDLDIVEGVLRMAEGLERPVVAEGVESLEIGLMLSVSKTILQSRSGL